MIFLGLAVGIYSYLLFYLGLVGQLNMKSVHELSILFILFLFVLASFTSRHFLSFITELISERKLAVIFFSLVLLCMVVVNGIGVLGPELAFDATWYHLTLPKIFLMKEAVLYIPGGVLYYSAMPKLAELLFLGGLSFGGQVFPKAIHFLFGLCTLILVYKTSRIFVSHKLSVFAGMIFYANLVVAWESTTAYVDLVWSFYSMGSIYLFLLFLQNKSKKYLYIAGLFVGLAISVKLVAIGSLLLLITAMMYVKLRLKNTSGVRKRDFIFVSIISLIVPFPWFFFSFIHTGNPFYPFFTPIYPTSFPIVSWQNFLQTISVFVVSPDPISPMYVLCLPMIILYRRLFQQKEKLLLFISGISLFIWFLMPKSGGGRFILTFLPLYSVLIAITAHKIEKSKIMYKIVLGAGTFILIISIGYRAVANSRYAPVVLGSESTSSFLTRNLNFHYGDFYDVDGFLRHKITKDDSVLLIGFHNLYYVDFPFIDQSWIRRGDRFNYVAVQNSKLPQRFFSMKRIYENKLTGVALYTERGKIWTY